MEDKSFFSSLLWNELAVDLKCVISMAATGANCAVCDLICVGSNFLSCTEVGCGFSVHIRCVSKCDPEKVLLVVGDGKLLLRCGMHSTGTHQARIMDMKIIDFFKKLEGVNEPASLLFVHLAENRANIEEVASTLDSLVSLQQPESSSEPPELQALFPSTFKLLYSWTRRLRIEKDIYESFIYNFKEWQKSISRLQQFFLNFTQPKSSLSFVFDVASDLDAAVVKWTFVEKTKPTALLVSKEWLIDWQCCWHILQLIQDANRGLASLTVHASGPNNSIDALDKCLSFESGVYRHMGSSAADSLMLLLAVYDIYQSIIARYKSIFFDLRQILSEPKQKSSLERALALKSSIESLPFSLKESAALETLTNQSAALEEECSMILKSSGAEEIVNNPERSDESDYESNKITEIISECEQGRCSVFLEEFDLDLQRSKERGVVRSDIGLRAVSLLEASRQNEEQTIAELIAIKSDPHKIFENNFGYTKIGSMVYNSGFTLQSKAIKELRDFFDVATLYKRVISAVELSGKFQDISAVNVPERLHAQFLNKYIDCPDPIYSFFIALSKRLSISIWFEKCKRILRSNYVPTELELVSFLEEAGCMQRSGELYLDSTGRFTEASKSLWLSHAVTTTIQRLLLDIKGMLSCTNDITVLSENFESGSEADLVKSWWMKVCGHCSDMVPRLHLLCECISSIAKLVRNDTDADCSFFLVKNLDDSLKCAAFVLNAVSEASAFIVQLGQHLKEEASFLSYDASSFFSTVLFRSLLLNDNAIITASSFPESAFKANSVSECKNAMTLNALKNLCENIALIKAACCPAIDLAPSSIFISCLCRALHDIYYEYEGWLNYVRSKVSRSRQQKRKISETTAAPIAVSDIKNMLRHPLFSLLDSNERCDLLDLYHSSESFFNAVKNYIFDDGSLPKHWPLDDLSLSSKDEARSHFKFPLLDVYDRSCLMTHMREGDKLLLEIEKFPIILSELIVAKWAINVIKWFCDLSNSWTNSSFGEKRSIITIARAKQLLDSRKLFRKDESETAAALAIFGVYCDGKLNKQLSRYLLAAHSLFRQLSLQVGLVDDLLADARSEMGKISATIALPRKLSDIHDKICSSVIEPDLDLVTSIEAALNLKPSVLHTAVAKEPENLDTQRVKKSVNRQEKKMKDSSIANAPNPIVSKCLTFNPRETFRALIESRSLFAQRWISEFNTSGLHQKQHVSSINTSTATSPFLLPMEVACGIRLGTEKNFLYGESRTPTIIKNVLNTSKSSLIEKAQNDNVSERYGASISRVLSSLPKCAEVLFLESVGDSAKSAVLGDFYLRDHSDSDAASHQKIRENVKKILENIIITTTSEMIFECGTISRSISEVSARSVILAAEIEDELETYNVLKSVSNPLDANMNYQRHSRMLTNNLEHNKVLLGKVIEGDLSIESLIKMQNDDFLTPMPVRVESNQHSVELLDSHQYPTTSLDGTADGCALDADSVLSSSKSLTQGVDIANNECESAAGPSSALSILPVKSSSDLSKQLNLPVSNSVRPGESISRPTLVRQNQVKSVLDLIKAGSANIVADTHALLEGHVKVEESPVPEAKEYSDYDTVQMEDDSVDRSGPLVCVIDDAGSHKLCFEWKTKGCEENIEGYGAVLTNDIKRLRFGKLEVKGRLNIREFDDYCRECASNTRYLLIPFVFVCDPGKTNGFRSFMMYLNNNRIGVCENLVGTAKYTIYMIPPLTVENLNVNQIPSWETTISEFSSIRKAPIGPESASWCYCVYIRSYSVESPPRSFAFLQHCGTPFPPAELQNVCPWLCSGKQEPEAGDSHPESSCSQLPIISRTQQVEDGAASIRSPTRGTDNDVESVWKRSWSESRDKGHNLPASRRSPYGSRGRSAYRSRSRSPHKSRSRSPVYRKRVSSLDVCKESDSSTSFKRQKLVKESNDKKCLDSKVSNGRDPKYVFINSDTDSGSSGDDIDTQEYISDWFRGTGPIVDASSKSRRIERKRMKNHR